jgi:hypothetical protein
MRIGIIAIAISVLSMSCAEKAGRKIDSAAHKTGQGLKKAGQKTGAALKKAGKKIEEKLD